MDREKLLKNILATSTHSWENINMLLEYDFSEKVDFQTFNLDEIFKDGTEIWTQFIQYPANFATQNPRRFL